MARIPRSEQHFHLTLDDVACGFLTSFEGGSMVGEVVSDASGGEHYARAKQWFASNFRLEIDGLDCKRVSRVDAFNVELGEAPIDFPGLRITLAEPDSASWRDWHQEFVVRGRNEDDQERKGALVVLDPALKELGKVDLAGLGIVRLEPVQSTPADAVPRLVAELYCERMELAF